MKKRKYLAFVSAATAFMLSAIVFVGWMKPFAIHTDHQQISQAYHVPTSVSLRIASVPPVIAGSGKTDGAVLLDHSAQLKCARAYERYQIEVKNQPQPLWLLNRSLLI